MDTPANEVLGHDIKIHINVSEPWQVMAAFQIIRDEASRLGFGNIDEMNFDLYLSMSGPTQRTDIETLKANLDKLWLPCAVESNPYYHSASGQ
jgi:hypothetical protein